MQYLRSQFFPNLSKYCHKCYRNMLNNMSPATQHLMLLTKVLGRQAVVIVGVVPNVTAVVSLSKAISFLRLAAVYEG